jgi:hypothetical protein
MAVGQLCRDLPPDMDTFYTPGAKGYADYPPLSAEQSVNEVSLGRA